MNKKEFSYMLEFAGELISTFQPADIKAGTRAVSSNSQVEILCTFSYKNTPLEDYDNT